MWPFVRALRPKLGLLGLESEYGRGRADDVMLKLPAWGGCQSKPVVISVVALYKFSRPSLDISVFCAQIHSRNLRNVCVEGWVCEKQRHGDNSTKALIYYNNL